MHTVHVLVLFQNRNLDCIESLLLKFFNHYDDLWCLYRIPISWPKITPTRLCIGTKGLDQRIYQTSILHQPLFTSPIYREQNVLCYTLPYVILCQKRLLLLPSTTKPNWNSDFHLALVQNITSLAFWSVHCKGLVIFRGQNISMVW